VVNQATLTPAKLESLARIVEYRQQLNDIAERSNRTRFASMEFMLRHYYGFLHRRYDHERVRFDGLPSNPPDNSPIHVTPAVRTRTGAAVYEDIAANWRNASITMQQVLAARGIE